MTQPSRMTSPPSQEHAAHSPRAHTSSSSPHHVDARSVAAGMHHFEHIAGAYPGVIVVDPNMMPPGYVIGQVATPRVEEPEEPLYVNAKQYHRILKRRAARANLEAQNRLMQRGRKFMHESRHLHAMRRPRGPGGRFLTAAEIAALEERETKSLGGIGTRDGGSDHNNNSISNISNNINISNSSNISSSGGGNNSHGQGHGQGHGYSNGNGYDHNGNDGGHHYPTATSSPTSSTSSSRQQGGMPSEQDQIYASAPRADRARMANLYQQQEHQHQQ